ncbi:hypothetical protein I302_100613 [Kwoniella bestiolae CBS 10118]|uniref:Zn(2)-C6 fungal-type domain-containing protein n=1 Tax=Kwoniella bestiolae CBS 10118 TaxID=1296100 RepID=A0A1B9G5J4_9TREE|nr:hypothetical protein I302_03987 [Kwoniella bestiolae CBS 10118]OCF26304.1 hypothetical protein I302_03987 [Kwoniella bestiolae CBS 10118]
MSLHLDYAEISRQARKIVDANRARSIIDQVISDPSTKQKVKYTRSTTGCLSCRSHKVKCDETVPACLRCVASQRKCEYPAASENKKRKSTSARNSRRSTSVSVSRDVDGDNVQSKRVRVDDEAYGQVGESPNRRQRQRQSPKSMSLVGDDGSKMDPSPGENSRMGGPSPMDILNLTSTPDFSFLNDFIPFPHITPPSQPLPPPSGTQHGTSSTAQNIFNTSPTTATVFTNDLTRPSVSHDQGYPQTNNAIASSSSTSSRNLPQQQNQYQGQQHTLPHFENFSKSLLLNRRLIKVNNTGGGGMGGGSGSDDGKRSLTPQMQILHPRLQLVESILQAYAHDEALFEFGPSHRHRNLSNNTLTAGVIDVLSNAFPSPTARTLFHHYCNTASRILITMGNIGPNPLLALCTPVKLLDTNSAASAAIRMSMLSTGIAHFIHETGSSLRNTDAALTLGNGQWERMRGKLKEISGKFKKAALSNITLAASSERSPDQVDSILAACTLLCIRDVISADPTWRDNLEFALNLITKKGGPQVMLQGSEYTFTRRYLLENLATHDVFASFITGKEPSMLGNYDSWWFDSVETSQTRWEWESVERSFGISRAMVDLVARIAVLDSQKRRLGLSLRGDIDEMWDVGQHFERESHCLLLELDIWGNSLNALPQHVRVTCGDYIYKYMAVVFILADILEQPTTTPRIVKSIDHILELISEASAMRMSVMLIWPLLIAGVFSLPAKRQKVVELFNALSDDYCEDLEVARQLLHEQWRLVDSGQGKQPWDQVMKKLGKYVLLI